MRLFSAVVDFVCLCAAAVMERGLVAGSFLSEWNYFRFYKNLVG